MRRGLLLTLGLCALVPFLVLAAKPAPLPSEPVPAKAEQYVLNIGAGDWAAEVEFHLPDFANRKKSAAWPCLVELSCGADNRLALSASTEADCELFLTGSGAATYARSEGKAQVRPNGDVGSGVTLRPDNAKRVRLRLENRAGVLRITQGGSAVLKTDKNLANGGSVNRLVFGGAGLKDLGGGTVAAVRFKTYSPARIGNYKLVWSDELDGSALDSRCWSLVPHNPGHNNTGGWRDNTSERKSDAMVKGGSLVLKGVTNNGRGDTDKNPPNGRRRFFCGQVWTKKKVNFSRGVFEIRAKILDQRGAWPAIWLMPENEDTLSWPLGGEIDIVERLNADSFVYQTVHHGPAPTPGRSSSNGNHSNTIDRNTWNVYRVEWTNEAIVWFVNGQETFRYAPANKNSDSWPFTTPYYIILSQQLEGNWVGKVPNDQAQKLDVDFTIDYVRVYQDASVDGTTHSIPRRVPKKGTKAGSRTSR